LDSSNHIRPVNSDALAIPLVPDFIGYVEMLLRRELTATVHDWSRCATLLSHWEDEHLLDNPQPELLGRHKDATERLLRFGRFLAIATEQPDFADHQLAQIVGSTQSCLQDKLALWHGRTLSGEGRAEILKSCFNES
jgi:hypothetical protein